MLCEGNEVKFKAIAKWAEHYPVVDLYEVLRGSLSAYYYWKYRPNLNSANTVWCKLLLCELKVLQL